MGLKLSGDGGNTLGIRLPNTQTSELDSRLWCRGGILDPMARTWKKTFKFLGSSRGILDRTF